MERYRVLVPFGPWARGEEFESSDEAHERMAAEGRLLERVGEGESGWPASPS